MRRDVVLSIFDYEGIKKLLQHASETFPRLKHLWLDAGYRGEDKGKDCSSSLALLVGVIAASTAIETSAVKPRGLLSRLLT